MTCVGCPAVEEAHPFCPMSLSSISREKFPTTTSVVTCRAMPAAPRFLQWSDSLAAWTRRGSVVPKGWAAAWTRRLCWAEVSPLVPARPLGLAWLRGRVLQPSVSSWPWPAWSMCAVALRPALCPRLVVSQPWRLFSKSRVGICQSSSHAVRVEVSDAFRSRFVQKLRISLTFRVWYPQRGSDRSTCMFAWRSRRRFLNVTSTSTLGFLLS